MKTVFNLSGYEITLYLFCIAILIWPASMEARVFDGYTESGAVPYVESVRIKCGGSRVEKVEMEALALARTLNQKDKATLDPEAFLKHVEMAVASRSRFFPHLSTDQFNEFLLPMRVRSEFVKTSGWRPYLAALLEPVVDSEPDSAIAASNVLAWFAGKVTLITPQATYALGNKGDLDPISTLRGHHGNEIDLSILAVCALRAIGIPSRLVYAPAIHGEDGGKVWVEYRGKAEWSVWVPSFADSVPLESHRKKLLDDYSGKLSLVVANPHKPINITPAYIPAAPLWFCPKPLDTESFQFSLMVHGRTKLMPLMGRNLEFVRPKDFDFGVGAGSYVMVSGIREAFVATKAVTMSAPVPGWFVTDFKAERQQFIQQAERPTFFEWEGAYSRTFKESWED